MRSLRSPVRLGAPGEDTPAARGGPPLGEHTESVLRSLGYDADRIQSLRQQRAFGGDESGR